MSKKKLYFVSLGCPKNRVDSEMMLGMAGESGYELVEDAESADLLVVNTCSFIEQARQESVDVILDLAELRTQHADKKLVVAGCLSQRYPDQLKDELPEVDHFLGTGQINRFQEILQTEAPRDLADGAPGWLYTHNSPRLQSTPFYTAYVKIAEGCDRTCSFCAIPSFRGKQKSRPIEDIVEEVRQLCARGVKEINLIAQELNGYGRDLPKSPSGQRIELADLLEALEQVEPGPFWIRLLYMYPHGFSDRLIGAIANSKRVVPYIDMPLQHASDAVLRKMRRAGNGQDIRNLLDKLRGAVPGITLRTTFLVGFPGETEEDFQQLYDFIQEQRFDRVGIFAFSREEGTASHDLPDQVDPEIAEERRRILYELQTEISKENLDRYLGRTIEVLVEGISEESELLLEGRFAGQAPDIDGTIYINDGQAMPGDIVQVEVEQTGDHDLVGGIVAHGPAEPQIITIPPLVLQHSQKQDTPDQSNQN
ncbi:MAG: 30S ribosomal protein S12 methylthiotransferase RimO [Myxococcales bacterium]|nr:30S ribosomal protein S12 methylthiotransferase RimO [Myxococcales bacterium]MCB9643042.1 30S ribosomal protein S12 methylthiotransferase RimO [Myxococcales bacterium]